MQNYNTVIRRGGGFLMLGSTEAAGSGDWDYQRKTIIYICHIVICSSSHTPYEMMGHPRYTVTECNKRKIPGICYVYICIHEYI